MSWVADAIISTLRQLACLSYFLPVDYTKPFTGSDVFKKIAIISCDISSGRSTETRSYDVLRGTYRFVTLPYSYTVLGGWNEGINWYSIMINIRHRTFLYPLPAPYIVMTWHNNSLQ